MKRFKYLFLILFLFPIFVYADKIYDLEMNININKDGSANFTEVWNVKATQGTEWYKSMYNMGNMTLSNYKVSMDGKDLSYTGIWDLSANMKEKDGKYGINYLDDGIELCFGKSDYKKHTFTLSYKLDNVIFNTVDSQVLYNTFFPNATAGSFKVTISSYYSFPDNLDVWGYGYKGYAYVKDGKIEMSNEVKLVNNDVVLLAKFPLGTFDTNNSYDYYKTFDKVYKTAKEGSYSYNYAPDIVEYINYYGRIVIPIFLAIVAVPIYKKKRYGYKGNKKITKGNTPLFRDIPCNKDIYYANALIALNEKDADFKNTNIYGAIILKWVKEGKIKFIKKEKEVFKNASGSLDLRTNPEFDVEIEQKIFNMMFEASSDGILDANEFEKWCKKNYESFLDTFYDIKEKKIDELYKEKHIRRSFRRRECKAPYVMDDTLYNESVKLYGLKYYLLEFSKMDTKEVLDVHLWEEYLMFAYLFGIAGGVARQLKKLYPEVIQDVDFNPNITLEVASFINVFSNISYTAASTAREDARRYSSGGGGFSSGGGGGGSFGGGGSMGGR